MCQALNLFGITLRTTDKDIQIYAVEITIDLFSPYCWAKAALGKLLLLVPHVPHSDLTRQRQKPDTFGLHCLPFLDGGHWELFLGCTEGH
jgi:hypothetical protein